RELLVSLEKRLHALFIELDVARTLIVLQPFLADFQYFFESSGALRRRRLPRRRALSQRNLVARGEAAQARLGAAAAVADRLLAHLARERQHAAAGHRAEEHGVDHRAALLRELAHVEEHRALGELRRGGGDAIAVEAAVGHLHLLHGGVDTVG